MVFAEDGLEAIGVEAFMGSGIESFTAPASLKKIEEKAFFGCASLKHADFSACVLPPNGETDFCLKTVFDESALESIVFPSSLRVIAEGTFKECEHLRSVSFGKDSLLEEIGCQAFQGCALESFEAPSSLKKIGKLAFCYCRALRDVKLTDNVQELGEFCFWKTVVKDLKMPSQVHMTPDQLGLGQIGSNVLCLPEGLEVVKDHQFCDVDSEKIVIPSSVWALGNYAFS